MDVPSSPSFVYFQASSAFPDDFWPLPLNGSLVFYLREQPWIPVAKPISHSAVVLKIVNNHEASEGRRSLVEGESGKSFTREAKPMYPSLMMGALNISLVTFSVQKMTETAIPTTYSLCFPFDDSCSTLFLLIPGTYFRGILASRCRLPQWRWCRQTQLFPSNCLWKWHRLHPNVGTFKELICFLLTPDMPCTIFRLRFRRDPLC